MAQTALILGASGKIGHHSARVFSAAGWQVKHFDRRTEDMREAARGVDVIVNGLNPPNYHNWAKLIPQITRDVIEAAQDSGASVLIPGNVYHFGDQGGIWSETTPPHPVSRKGQIRLEMEQAYKQSGVQTIVLRAGNFVDPERNGCVMSLVYLRTIARGKITLPGPSHTRQAICYVPDWARAGLELMQRRASLEQFEDIPFPGHTLSADMMKTILERALGRRLKFSNFPWWAFRAMGPFWELAREMNEMRYLWQTDHALCDSKFRRLLPEFKATDLESVVTAALPPDMLQARAPGAMASAQ